MNENIRLRILVLGVIVIALFSALFARLWYLQVISVDQYAAAAEGNRVRTVPREAPRGRILDRRGRILVDNRVANVVSVSRSLAGDERDRVIRELSKILRISGPEIEERLSDFRFADFRPIPVLAEADEATLVAIREREDELPGVEAVQSAVRVYPQGHLAAHVLGYVGEINDQELEARRDEGYELGSTIGKVGIEQAYETDLRGTPGVEFYEVDRVGSVVRRLGEREAQQGNDVQLSIDLDVQRAAENALERFILLARDNAKPATGGAVVALDVTDGSVAAMASYPSFDPGEFVHGISTATWERLNDPTANLPLNNRAIQGLYPPGSTFKIVTSLAGLSAQIITPDTTIVDSGAVEIGGRFFRNAGRKSYGRVDLRRALTVSSDVFYYLLGEKIDGLESGEDEEIQRVARLFGFGQPTGIELPFEQDGRVPDRRWKGSVHAANPDAFPEGNWFTGDSVNLAIGQGDLLATPLQIATAYATLANGGQVFPPHLGSRVIDRFGAVVRPVQPEADFDMADVITAERRAAILQGLRGVVANREGTASSVFGDYSGPTVSGKTGTSEIRGREDTALFVGMFPADAPKYVILALVEEGGAGADIAAPIVRHVIETLVANEADTGLPPIGTLTPTRAPTPTSTSTTPSTAPLVAREPVAEAVP